MTEENIVGSQTAVKRERPVLELDPDRTARLVEGVKQNLRNHIDGLQIIKYLPNAQRYESIINNVSIINTWLQDERYEPYINREELQALIKEGESFAESIKPEEVTE